MVDVGRSRRGISVVVVSLVLLASAGVASAAVAGEFQATYDGYNTEQDTDARGHEIAVSGDLEITGDTAVDPRIIITGAEHTVLATSSVEVFVEGDRSIQFEREYDAGRVELRTSEIPAGTTVRISFLTYFVGGTDAAQLKGGQVTVIYETPSGTSERTSFAPTADVSNSPELVINDLEQGDRLSEFKRIGFWVGVVAIVILLLLIGMKIRGGGNGGLPS